MGQHDPNRNREGELRFTGRPARVSPPRLLTFRLRDGVETVLCPAGCLTAPLPSTYQVPGANFTPLQAVTTKKLLRHRQMSRGAKLAQVENRCIRQLMVSHLGRTAGLQVLLSCIMASLATKRRSLHPFKQSCDFHVPAGTSLASQVLGGSGKAQRSGSAPVVSRRPREVVSTGCPAEGLNPRQLPPPWKRHLYLVSTEA